MNSTNTTKTSITAKLQKAGKAALKLFAVLVVLMVVLGLVLEATGEGERSRAARAIERKAEAERMSKAKETKERAEAAKAKLDAAKAEDLRKLKQPENEISVERFAWKKGGFGSVMVADVALKNGNAFPVKDVRLRCAMYGGSLTVLGRIEAVVYQVIAEGRTLVVRDLNVGFLHPQTERADCVVTGARLPW